MQGQWIGSATSEGVPARIIMDVDDFGEGFRGTARVFIDGEPGAICEFTTFDRAAAYVFEKLPLAWIPLGQASITDRTAISAANPDRTFPETARIELVWNDANATVKWSTDTGTFGEGRLSRARADLPSELCPVVEVVTWDKFKEFALSQPPGRFIFRGQPGSFRLRTAFHRSHRKDLVRYVADDIPLAYRLLTARTRHLFDLTRPEQEGAFWNLLQHHGYPTPLLDWSQSPFVAAFFAYRNRQPPDAPSDQVRILAFDAGEWTRDFVQLQAVNFADLHFSILTAMAIENPRAIPQQGVSTLTNVDDIESYIRVREAERSKTYLYAIDLPASLRREVMIELSLMGLTAGSLFPGLDGTCEELRGRMFHQ